MKTQKPLFVAVALMSSPLEGAAIPDSAVMMTIDTNVRKVIALARNPSSGGMFFRAGYCISVYQVSPGADLTCYKDHRIGDDMYSETSPIILIRHFSGEKWEEQWFDKKLEKLIGPAPQPEAVTNVSNENKQA